MADLLDPDARPMIAGDVKGYGEHDGEEAYGSRKVVKKVDMFSENKWVKVKLCQDEDGDFFVSKEDADNEANAGSGKNMFRKRGGRCILHFSCLQHKLTECTISI